MKKLILALVMLSGVAANAKTATLTFSTMKGSKEVPFVSCEIDEQGAISATYLDGIQNPGISTSVNDKRLQSLSKIKLDESAAVRQFGVAKKHAATNVISITVDNIVIYQELANDGHNNPMSSSSNQMAQMLSEAIYEGCTSIIYSSRFQDFLN